MFCLVTAKVVSCQAECSIPPKDLQIIMSEVQASIIYFVVIEWLFLFLNHIGFNHCHGNSHLHCNSVAQLQLFDYSSFVDL